MYEKFTAILPAIAENPHHWWRESGADDALSWSPVLLSLYYEIYAFADAHPQEHLNEYEKLLNAHGIVWSVESMSGADVQHLDGPTVMALLVGAARAEHYVAGSFTSLARNGSIERWIRRLAALDGLSPAAGSPGTADSPRNAAGVPHDLLRQYRQEQREREESRRRRSDPIRRISRWPLPDMALGRLRTIRLFSEPAGASGSAHDGLIGERLTLHADGRVTLTRTLSGETPEGMQTPTGQSIHGVRHKIRFQISTDTMAYLFGTLRLAMDRYGGDAMSRGPGAGVWAMVLTDEENNRVTYTGPAVGGISLFGLDLSVLLRNILGIEDMLAFGGRTQSPVIIHPDEYRMVFVTLGEEGGPLVCCLCDDPDVQREDRVVLRFGPGQELVIALVDHVEVHRAEDAPCPVRQCPKILQVLRDLPY